VTDPVSPFIREMVKKRMDNKERNGALVHFQSPLVIFSRSRPIREFIPDYVTSVLDVKRFRCIFRSFALRTNDSCSLSIPSARHKDARHASILLP
jgi:hypothetical protein